MHLRNTLRASVMGLVGVMALGGVSAGCLDRPVAKPNTTLQSGVRIPVTNGAGNHTPGFTACAATEEAHAATLRASKALAFAALDLYSNPDLLAAAKDEFERVTAK